MPEASSLMWFRRDLRLHDNAALSAALAAGGSVYGAFIFDRDILDRLIDPNDPFATPHDRRVEFIRLSLEELDAAMRERGGRLIVRHASAADEIPKLAAALKAHAVFTNHDYEPYAIERDARVAEALRRDGRELKTARDQCIFEKSQLMTGAGKPFMVFTPYKNAWLKTVRADDLAPRDCERGRFAAPKAGGKVPGSSDARALDAAMPTLDDMGFASTNLLDLGFKPGMSGAAEGFDDFCARIDHYADRRDFPAKKGQSYLSVHLRFGTLSIRGLARDAHARMLRGSRGAEVWLSELIWRDFYFQVLYHHPHVATRACKPDYDRLRFDTGAHADALFAAWCEGRTGYPIVDAAMAQLNDTGWMHNRLRMVAASFLIKDLGIDYRRGEAYFAARLNDFDLSANNGGWQWCASTGCDAQPYFRIFNPISQSEKFDGDGAFIKRYLPQLADLSAKAVHAPWTVPSECDRVGLVLGRDYASPIVMHDEARKRTLQRYAVVRKTGEQPAD